MKRSYRKNTYATWQEASEASEKLNITGLFDYLERYKEDPKLPSHPQDYPRFPGWRKFLGTEFYSTLEEVIDAVQKLDIKSRAEYFENRYKDSKLPSVSVLGKIHPNLLRLAVFFKNLSSKTRMS